MIKCVCRCYLDDYLHADWPNQVVTVPNKGDWVKAKTGARGPPLRVNEITFCQYEDGTPYIEITLIR